jgi:ubiquinone/menaquinone biosynthesis C-methylase UbiE
MDLKDAIALLRHNSFHPTGIQAWADLGSGSGLFTSALASQLASGSTIYAVDSNHSALTKIIVDDRIAIHPVQADFTVDRLDFSGLNGLLIANSLHYVNDKPAFILKAGGYIKPGGCFLIVEYDTDKPVPRWVPYPLSFQSLERLFETAGYLSIIKLNERPSLYNRGTLYSAMVTR